jgi:hypothetical protein
LCFPTQEIQSSLPQLVQVVILDGSFTFFPQKEHFGIKKSKNEGVKILPALS